MWGGRGCVLSVLDNVYLCILTLRMYRTAISTLVNSAVSISHTICPLAWESTRAAKHSNMQPSHTQFWLCLTAARRLRLTGLPCRFRVCAVGVSSRCVQLPLARERPDNTTRSRRFAMVQFASHLMRCTHAALPTAGPAGHPSRAQN